MILRVLRPDEYREHNKVASQAFIYPCEPDEDDTLPASVIPGAFLDDNKTLTADMELEMRLCHFHGSLLTCAAIGGVASKPEYRRMGAIRALFSAMFEGTFTKELPDISILYPFSESYYRKFGYESAGYALRVEAPFSELSEIERFSDVVLCEADSADKLLSLYNRCFQNYDLSFVRTDAGTFPLEPYKTNRYTYRTKQEDAYISYSVNREKSTVEVEEIGFTDPAALRKILGFIRCYDGNIKRIVFHKLPLYSPVFSCFAGREKAKCELYSVGAVRIINVESVLKKKSYPSAPGVFTVRIVDTLQRNNACFTVRYREGTGEVQRDIGEEPDLTLDICAAARLLLCGIPDPMRLPYENGVTLHKENEDFFRAFPYDQPFFCDCF